MSFLIKLSEIRIMKADIITVWWKEKWGIYQISS